MSWDDVAISGVGWSRLSKESGQTPIDLALTASLAAAADAGIDPHSIDGIIEYSRRDSPLALPMAAALGLPVLRYFLDYDGGGYASQTVVATAANAVRAGLADTILVYRAMNGRTGPHRFGGAGQVHPVDVFGDQGQFSDTAGLANPVQTCALKANAYMHRYGTTQEQLGAVAIAIREHASRNERAVMREPITMEDYLQSRLIAEPFHVFDCALETDGACALIVTSRERATASGRPVVLIRAASIGAGPFATGGYMWEDPAEMYSKWIAPDLYARAGITAADIDVAEIYDCFTYTLLCQLEDYGFAPKGEGGRFVEDGNLGLGGRIPTNTHGGLLSEAYLQGLGHVCEAVVQLRHEAGARQAPDPEFALTTGHGFNMGGALVLQRAS